MKGTFLQSSQILNIYSKNDIFCDINCKSRSNNIIKNKILFDFNKEYENINGILLCNNYQEILQNIDVTIPKKIFQTHKSIDYVNSKEKTKNATLSWKKYTDFEYNFYSDEDCDKFIEEYFPDIYVIYKKLPRPIMKADIWRYCVIYYYGGIYADVDTVCKFDPNQLLHPALLTGVPETDNIHLCQWIFAAPPKSPLLKSILDLFVERYNKGINFKQEHIVHYLTGPGVFTDGIENYLLNNKLPILFEKKNYKYYPKNILYMYNCDIFHREYIIHLFTGLDPDGWTNDLL